MAKKKIEKKVEKAEKAPENLIIVGKVRKGSDIVGDGCTAKGYE